MGQSHDEFVKYPRTPHLCGSEGTDDDKHLGEAESRRLLADASLIVEEKLDGTNVGLHFASEGRMVLQCRGHLITEGMHPQYGLFKRWAAAKRPVLEERLGRRYILFGVWVYARVLTPVRVLDRARRGAEVAVLGSGVLGVGVGAGCPGGNRGRSPRSAAVLGTPNLRVVPAATSPTWRRRCRASDEGVRSAARRPAPALGVVRRTRHRPSVSGRSGRKPRHLRSDHGGWT